MKSWAKKPFTKAALSVIAVGMSIIVCLSGVMLIYKINDSEGKVVGVGESSYEESGAFEQRMGDASRNVLERIRVKEELEPVGTYDPNCLVDVMTYEKEGKISGKNESGLAYRLADIADWGMKYNQSDLSAENVVVCEKTDGTYHYYYMDEFKNLLKNSGLKLVFPNIESGAAEDPFAGYGDPESETIQSVIGVLRDGYSLEDTFGMAYAGAKLTDKEGKLLYTDFWAFTDVIQETAVPDGAENLLQVVNDTPELNGKLSEVYEAVINTISNLAVSVDIYETGGDLWTEGNTNYTYLIADRSAKKVYTNNSEYTDFTKLEDNIEALKNAEHSKYVIVKPKLGDFESNLDVSASEWKNIVQAQEIFGEDFLFAAAVDTSYPIQDVFYDGAKAYATYAPYAKIAGISFILSAIVLLIDLIWLGVVAGRRADDKELHLNAFDRWKTEIGAAAVIVPWIFLMFAIGSNWSGFGYQAVSYYDTDFEYAWHYGNLYYTFSLTAADVAVISFFAAFTMILFLIGYLSLVRRIKGKTLWKNSLLRWLLNAASKGWDLFWKNRNITVKVILLLIGFVGVHWLMAIFGSAFLILAFAVDVTAAVFLIKWAVEKDRIKKGIQKIASGDLEYQIPCEKMSSENRQMAELVNDIGNGLNRAVEAGIKSERLKTDLITNVSHDIKTPLTSIINYVDLLKRENFDDPKIQGYLEILEAKSQRLKTLTEDVVEASKVSSGNITLEMMDVNLVEMTNQTIGEFSEKMEAKKLTVVAALPEEPAIIHVDGRRMWRVLENIFNNAAKYAMPGTRIYVDLKVKEAEEGKKTVLFSMKNMSENPLNINADELTERFIRGDISRSTEGSGLGLSIAKNLTEMQGGTFTVYVDGDLFKVMIEFPAR